MGTTNALIFYANIIHTNRTIFFPQNNVSIVTRFLAVFIAWLNLDIGIETCLYRGMTAYANTWLQFVFPVYIWLLVLIMIYSSRYSVTASKLIGRNAVSVLATLFLLSYAKLLRTIIAVVSPISIEDEDRKHPSVVVNGWECVLFQCTSCCSLYHSPSSNPAVHCPTHPSHTAGSLPASQD